MFTLHKRKKIFIYFLGGGGGGGEVLLRKKVIKQTSYFIEYFFVSSFLKFYDRSNVSYLHIIHICTTCMYSRSTKYSGLNKKSPVKSSAIAKQCKNKNFPVKSLVL